MNMETGSLDGQLPLHGVGDKLRMAREKAGMTLGQLAAETRIPQRHLELIEAGDWHDLPARTYATGFARTYAKAVGLDPRATVDEVRAELSMSEPGDRSRASSFEPGDPARVPSRGLALFSLFAVVMLIVGGFFFYSRVLAPGAGPGSLLEEQRLAEQAAAAQAQATARPAAQAAAPTGGAVVFTALEEGVWVKFYDGQGAQLMQKQMAKGESYTVPADATGPQVWTGRPDALAITIGGKSVPKLADSETVMKDVPVTAEALLARNTAPAPTASPPATANQGPAGT
ncbi:Helix-turn-helix domain protein [Tsuneonella dongtanensis]|uniref:Helix-turn-helix domain protein n=1 Tax=Tsuneonella dongtanensis TaxID=692370 RepID=A0A1B2ABN7_9SPHN|nr:helix-turn-helix domain-containing protein [Tsuneonella dongtanensis]ANY19498.1 Helix-turn-helix domain protein [Tsuneonella dongtanensis]